MKTSTGYEFHVKPISPMLIDKIQRTIPEPTPPTYIAKTVGGGEEVHEHDETTLETPEDHAVWKAYLGAKEDRGAAITDKLLELFILIGTDLELPEDDSWVEMHQYLGLDVPTDDLRALKVYWVKTEVLGSGQDLTNLMMEVMRSTGVDEEVLGDVQASFRGALQGEATDRTDGEDARAEVRLDPQPSILGSQGDGTVEHYTQGVLGT